MDRFYGKLNYIMLCFPVNFNKMLFVVNEENFFWNNSLGTGRFDFNYKNLFRDKNNEKRLFYR